MKSASKVWRKFGSNKSLSFSLFFGRSLDVNIWITSARAALGDVGGRQSSQGSESCDSSMSGIFKDACGMRCVSQADTTISTPHKNFIGLTSSRFHFLLVRLRACGDLSENLAQ